MVNWLKYNQLIMIPVVTLLLMSACSEKLETKEQKIASVDGEPVYAAELKVIEQRFLGKIPQNMLNDIIKEKMLDTLLRSKAMAMAIENDLSDEQQRILDAQVRVFRDDMLVRLYMEKYGDKADISSEQIKRFYHNNLQLFGGGSKKTIETVQLMNVESASQKSAVLAHLAALKDQQDWGGATERLREEGFQLKYNKQQVNPAVLQSPLKEGVVELTHYDDARLITNGGIFLLRVLEEQSIPGKPLSEVSAEIEQILLRKSYRESVEKLSDSVMQNVQIVKE